MAPKKRSENDAELKYILDYLKKEPIAPILKNLHEIYMNE